MKKTSIRKALEGLALGCALTFALGSTLFSCADITSSASDSNQFSSIEYGSLSICDGLAESARALDISTLTSATVTVSGYGMSDITKTDVSITNGASSASIENIPVGNNRVVTVKSNVDGATLRAVCDIKGVKNTVTINWSTTALGNVFYNLIKKGTNVAEIAKTAFDSAIDKSVHASLIDAEAIAAAYPSMGAASSYISDYGRVSVKASNASGYTVQITDIASEKVAIDSTSLSKELKAYPGTWKAWVLDSSGAKVAEKDITVVAGETSTVEVKYDEGGEYDFTGKTIAFVKASSAPHIWAWEEGGVALSEKLGGAWNSSSSATLMTAVPSIYMKDNSGWYMIDYSSYATGKTIKFQLNWNNGTTYTGAAGTFWYDSTSSGSATTTNPSPASSEASITLTVNSPVPPADAVRIYVSSTSGAPTLWVHDAGGHAISENMGEVWPGNAMSSATGLNDNTNWYVKEIPGEYISGDIIKYQLNSAGTPVVSGKTTTFWYDAAGLVGSAGTYYDSDPTTVPEPVSPTLTISPASGKEIGTASSIKVSASFGNDTPSVNWLTINGKSYAMSEGSNVYAVSEFATEAGKTITVKGSLTNSKGTATINATYTTKVTKEDPFTWDNVNCYFVLTDRFYNGDSSNDHSYYRQNAANNSNLSSGYNNVATFHGGDIKGLTAKMDYFKKLGVNAIWITAPYEQAHGWCTGGGNGFPHYAFHGYYTQDWTYMDQNMGTIKEFRTFVQTCHANGIRVVMDVVMNHTGYNTVEDMITYNFGKYSSITKSHGWCANEGSWTANPDSSSVSDYWNGDNWETWWGKWIRSFNYSNCLTGNGDYDKCGESGLPDVRSEMEEIVDIPTFLQTKWTNEPDSTQVPASTGNTLGNKYGDYKLPTVSNVDWWNKTGDWRENQKGCPVEYQIVWLSAWVREFGIDGFRCDTAKHVQPKYWGKLKDACEDALAKWREDDSKIDTSGAKDWDEGFWTTGECFTYYNAEGGRSDSNYFGTNDQGKFDSMINFSMNSNHSSQTNSKYPSTEDWANYAAIYAENNDTDGNGNRDNSLMYLSSHDTSLCRPGDQFDVGTKFVLLPGGIQIYYGDESLRGSAFTDCGDNDMTTRGDMNWSDGTLTGSVSNGTSNDTLVAHWGKLGNFRKYNPAVGAGVQTVSGSTYVRSYSGSAGESKVAISISGTSVDVSGLYSDGTTVYNWYDGKSATVSGGSVTFAGGTTSQPILVSDKNPANYDVTF